MDKSVLFLELGSIEDLEQRLATSYHLAHILAGTPPKSTNASYFAYAYRALAEISPSDHRAYERIVDLFDTHAQRILAIRYDLQLPQHIREHYEREQRTLADVVREAD